MGGGPSLDGEIAEAKQISVDFAKNFVLNYGKLYTLGLMKDTQKKMLKAAQGPQWKLTKCDKWPPPPVRKEGVILKRSKHLKKWNPRYFVVKGDWIVDYYETKEKYEGKQKPLGSVNLSGMRVVRDPNNTLLNKLIALAEKCKLNLDDFPKPEKFNETTLLIEHDRKDTYFLDVQDPEHFKSWCDMFDDARWYAPTLNINDDKVHKRIFTTALWWTRWQCDMWGWASFGGGEEFMMSDCINEQIAWVVMGKVDAKLTMPWAVRSRIRDGFCKTTSAAVQSIVGPAWQACYEGVKKVRPEIEKKLPDLLGPIVEAQTTVQKKIIEMVEASARDTVNEKIAPHLQPLLEIVFSPVIDSMRILLHAYDRAIHNGKSNFKKQEDNLFMVWHYNYNSEFWDADRKLWDLYDPLWAMRQFFEDVSPWSIQYKARRRLRKNLDNALYTFEIMHNQGEKGYDECAAEVRALLVEDCKAGIMRTLGHILFGCVENFWEKTVIRAARKLVEPIAEMIPAPVQDFVNVVDMVTDILNNILRAMLAILFEPFVSRIDLNGPCLTF